MFVLASDIEQIFTYTVLQIVEFSQASGIKLILDTMQSNVGA